MVDLIIIWWDICNNFIVRKIYFWNVNYVIRLFLNSLSYELERFVLSLV